MKRYVLLVGGTGARLADAMLVAASAGAFPKETIDVLLADTDRRGVRSAGLVAAKMADYARVQQAMQKSEGPFRTELAFSSWPETLPGDASTIAQFTAGSEEDALLCQALFDQGAAELDLHEGFHGQRMLGQVAYAGLLHEAEQNPEDPLACLVDDMAAACREDEEVRVVLAGSVCGGTGAAGIAALTRYIRQRTENKAHIGAVVLGPVADEQDAATAHEAIAAFAAEQLLETMCLLALPKASRAAAPAEYAQLTDWLAVYAMDMLLHRPQWATGLFTVQAPEGPLSWDIFGKAAARYRLCYGGLVKFASAWVGGLSANIEKRLRKPVFLRDGLFGWYAHFFRHVKEDSADQLAIIEPLTRLMNVCLIWLGGVMKTLPVDLRNASVLSAARSEAETHYAELTDLVSRLAVMDDDAARSELYEDNLVYRSKNSTEAAEAEANIRRIAAAKAEMNRRVNVQADLNRKIGGAAAMNMLHTALDAARQEAEELRARHDEAVRRIDHAEKIASDEDQYRITDARIKLRRMERHQLMLDSKLAHIQADVDAANAEGLRFGKPTAASKAPENSMIIPEAADMLLLGSKMNRAAVERLWSKLVCPGSTVNLKQCLKDTRRAEIDKDAPLASFVEAMIKSAMKEV